MSKNVIKSSASPKKISDKDKPKISFYEQHPKWAFQYFDTDNNKYGASRLSTDLPKVIKWMGSLELQTWSNVLNATSGRKGNTRNHRIPLEKLDSNAVKNYAGQFIKGLDEFGELYSLAIRSRERLWGVIIEGTFCVIWYDPNHEICESTKRHT
ncbi:hypothetical protein FACS1894105_08820 [Clostridia bacterium]|nr:hypothetical protein FACS1894105_08820 [Clostridia bacterium]